jgi:hypothetical protein
MLPRPGLIRSSVSASDAVVAQSADRDVAIAWIGSLRESERTMDASV